MGALKFTQIFVTLGFTSITPIHMNNMNSFYNKLETIAYRRTGDYLRIYSVFSHVYQDKKYTVCGTVHTCIIIQFFFIIF